MLENYVLRRDAAPRELPHHSGGSGKSAGKSWGSDRAPTAAGVERCACQGYAEEASVPTIEERVAYLEGQVSEQIHAMGDIREAVRSLEHRMDARFEAVDRRFDTVERRIDVLDDKVSRQFVWLVGLQVTTLVATVGALAAIVSAVLTRA
jgi:hypothetical protein